MSPFSTHHVILGNYEVLSQIYQPMFHLFSYLNSARHSSVIGFCRELNKLGVFSVVPEKITFKKEFLL